MRQPEARQMTLDEAMRKKPTHNSQPETGHGSSSPGLLPEEPLEKAERRDRAGHDAALADITGKPIN